MKNITKQIARTCNRIQLPLLLIWSLSVVVLVVAAFRGIQWLGVGAALVLVATMVAVLAAILIELSLVYRTFDRTEHTWTTAWGHTFAENHMPGKVARE